MQTWRDPSSPGGDPSQARAVPGTLVGNRYGLRSPIGHGGMGTVWRAADTLLRRDVAVKEVILPPAMPQSERDALCERTLREARAAAALSHPSVVQVYDVVTDGGRPWIVMELLEARSLADMVIDDGPLSARAVAKIGVAMLGALEVAHAAGVLHRDVKPANVLVCTDGRCVLTDFGVARVPTESNLTTPGMVLGSPHFISPERAVGGSFGPPSDLFSLGVTLYTAVEGGPPFDKGDPFETMRAVVEEAPRPTRLAGPLGPVLWGLLEKDPARRWTVDESRHALRELLSTSLSRSGHAHAHADTDPYAVIRPPIAPPPPPPPARAASQVGGRALLGPDDPIPGMPPSTGTRAGAQLFAGGPSTGGMPALGGTGDMPALDSGAYPVSPHAPAYTPAHGTRRRAASGGAGRVAGARDAAAGIGADLVAGVRGLGRRARHTQRRSRLVVAAGLALILVLVAVAALTGMFSGHPSKPNTVPPTTAAASPTGRTPLIPSQVFTDSRGITANVPAGWIRSTGGSYIDFTDPDKSQGERKIRFNVEAAGSTATRFLQAAENGLKKNCTKPYTRVALNDTNITLAGHPGAELEYTCGSGDSMRHGLWRAVVIDGKAYHFYLTVPESRMDDSKIIYQELVESFTLAV
jgi:hypothetical protein